MNPPTKKRILLVDDDLAILKVLQQSLKDQFELTVAPTTYDVESLINHVEPDLVILDIVLPDGNGTDLCASLRQRPEFNSLAILLLSGIGESQVAAAAIRSGADGYITKPFDIDVVRNTAAHLMQSKHLDRLHLSA